MSFMKIFWCWSLCFYTLYGACEDLKMLLLNPSLGVFLVVLPPLFSPAISSYPDSLSGRHSYFSITTVLQRPLLYTQYGSTVRWCLMIADTSWSFRVTKQSHSTGWESKPQPNTIPVLCWFLGSHSQLGEKGRKDLLDWHCYNLLPSQLGGHSKLKLSFIGHFCTLSEAPPGETLLPFSSWEWGWGYSLTRTLYSAFLC